MRDLKGRTLVVASHNAGKLREFADLLGPFGIDAKSAKEFGLPEPDETGTTFEENAYIKAFAAASATGLPAMSDDSGLVVDALDGAPGIYSARWAGPTKDFSIAMRKVEDALKGKRDRRAKFVAALALAWPDGRCDVFEGEVDGALVWPPRGAKGFGYDPMFVPEGYAITFGEMEPAKKHEMSHRARAFAKLVKAWSA